MSRSEKFKIVQIILTCILFTNSFFLKHETVLFFYNLATFVFIGFTLIIKSSLDFIRGKLFNETTLMIAASICAFCINEAHEAIIVLTLYELGELFEHIAVKKSKTNIKALLDIQPKYANLLIDNEIKRIEPEELNIGDIIIIKPFEKIPVDSIIVNGSSSINEASLTGESKLKEVRQGDNLYSGTINEGGTLKAKVTKLYNDSQVMTILKLISESDSKKAKAEKFVSKFAKYYTPLVISIALIIGVLIPMIKQDSWIYYLKLGCQFVVISCPCALVISVPLAFFLSIGKASKEGILIKGSSYLETLSNIKVCVFDKTGTLTNSKFRIKEIRCNNIQEEELLCYCYIAESRSNHPLAKGIQASYSYNILEEDIKEYEELPGMGVCMKYKEDTILVGNNELLKSFNINIELKQEKYSTLHIAINNEFKGTIILEDTIKEGAIDALTILEEKHQIKNVLLSGDNSEITKNIASILKIKHFKGELKPKDKLDNLEELMKDNKITAFVGDGINDSPCLKRADVGISMGSLGSDAAIECSDVIIMDDKLEKIERAIKISKKTKNIIKFNIIFILLIKFSVMLISLFYQNFYLAIFSDVGVSVIAILNSVRILKSKKPTSKM